MTATTHAFELGDHVVIVGSYLPKEVTGVGTVTRLTPGETYDVWARFGQHAHPFRAEELALAADGGLIPETMPTEPIPTVTVGRRWSNPAHLATMLGLGLVLGVITGVLAAPVETVEVRTTVTLAAPPVCEHAARAGGIKDDLADTAAAHHDAVLTHTIAAFEAQVYGDVDEMVAQQEWANAEKLLRDEAQRAADDARVSFDNHAAACLTWTVPQRFTERIPQ